MKNQSLRQHMVKLMSFYKKLYVIIGYNAFAFFQEKGIFFVKILNLGLDLPKEKQPKLSKEDEVERLQFQLYYYILSRIEIENKTILDISCGLGGGCYYINRYLSPLQVTGLDLISLNIRLAKQYYTDTTINFVQGDACDFSLPSESFDIVVNLESSHSYIDFKSFVKNTYEVLKPGGYFTFGDIRINNQVENTMAIFKDCGFEVILKEDITQSVISSLDKDENRKLEMLKGFWNGKTLFKSFSFLKGSRNYNTLKSGKWTFFHVLLRKEIN